MDTCVILSESGTLEIGRDKHWNARWEQRKEHHASKLLINTDLGTAVEAIYNQINEYSDLQIEGDRVNLKYDQSA